MGDGIIDIDCYGRCYFPEITVRLGDRSFNFVFDDSLKRGRLFSYGLFLNDQMRSRHCFKYPKERRFAVLVESPVRPIYREAEVLSRRYSRVFTHWRPLLEGGMPFTTLYYGTSWLPHLDATQSFSKKKLVSFIGSLLHEDRHGYGLRKDVARTLASCPGVDRYGYGIREVKSKEDALRDYCFSVAMENTRDDYYFTEKLIDCFVAESVPIYWGCPSIDKIFDKRGMIVFEDVDNLRQIIETLSFERYAEMLPHLRKNREIVFSLKLNSLQNMYERLLLSMDWQYMTNVSPSFWHKIYSFVRRIS